MIRAPLLPGGAKSPEPGRENEQVHFPGRARGFFLCPGAALICLRNAGDSRMRRKSAPLAKRRRGAGNTSRDSSCLFRQEKPGNAAEPAAFLQK